MVHTIITLLLSRATLELPQVCHSIPRGPLIDPGVANFDFLRVGYIDTVFLIASKFFRCVIIFFRRHILGFPSHYFFSGNSVLFCISIGSGFIIFICSLILIFICGVYFIVIDLLY